MNNKIRILKFFPKDLLCKNNKRVNDTKYHILELIIQ